jgi:H+/Cl- antiporter ClcA
LKDILDNNIKTAANTALISLKWVVFSVISGIVIGLVGTLFYFSMAFVTNMRGAHPWLIYFLPFGGLIIVWAYHVTHNEKDKGTNLVLSSIHSGDEIPLRMAPLIFISTLITHLCGGSAGREGAALQLGGSIGNWLGKIFRFDENDKRVMIMCGMSACFSALFGTPMAAAIFSMEVVSVGIMHYSALVPCVVSALVAHGIASYCGASGETFSIGEMPVFGIGTSVRVVILAVLCALVSILFCVILHEADHLYKKYLKNPYIRVFVGGCLVIVLTLIVGEQTYNGAGMNIVEKCFGGEAVSSIAFLLKILFTAVTLGAGYKGGEIVPTFCIGASFGYLFGNVIGFSPSLCTAVGMVSVFCGVTNAPLSTLLISFELFGYEGMPYYLLAVAFSYMLSGYFGLYHSQKIMYSKYKTNFINTRTR